MFVAGLVMYYSSKETRKKRSGTRERERERERERQIYKLCHNKQARAMCCLGVKKGCTAKENQIIRTNQRIDMK